MNRFSVLFVLTTGTVIGLVLGLIVSPMIAQEANLSIPMWLEVIHRVSTSVGGIGTFVALLFVVRQFNLLRAQSELVQKNTQASMDGQLYARLDSFNKFIVEHDKEYELLNEPYRPTDSTEHKYRLHHLCDLGFTFYEEIYKHHVRYQLLDTEDWDEWQQNMAHFFAKPYVVGYWRTVAGRFARSFESFANQLLHHAERKS